MYIQFKTGKLPSTRYKSILQYWFVNIHTHTYICTHATQKRTYVCVYIWHISRYAGWYNFKRLGSGIRFLGLQYCLYYLIAMWPWESDLKVSVFSSVKHRQNGTHSTQ